MQPSEAGVWAALPLVGLLGVTSVLLRPVPAQATGKTKIPLNRPGDDAYTPTKLEWAALELQSGYGQTTWTSETPVMVNFSPLDDGRSVLCLLQYTPDVSAEVVRINRDAEQQVFDIYAHKRGWSWLRLQFQEHILPRPTR
jgi:hypothetical protein